MKKLVLVIDDEEDIRKIYRKVFRALGAGIFDVFEASNATEATNCLIRHEIDIILLDIKMPAVDGRTMFEIIKEYNPRSRVIVASVYPVDKQRRLLPEASDYYDKSNGPIKLLEKIASTLV